MLRLRLLYLKDFVQTTSGLLVNNKFSRFYEFWVPFYVISPVYNSGLLLDIANYDVKTFRKKKEYSNNDCFTNYVRIFDGLTDDTCHTSLPFRYYQIPQVIAKTENLDEITPVEDDTPELNELDNADSIESVLILDPRKLTHYAPKRRRKAVSYSEQRQIVRVTILYVLGFFALILVTFFIIYLA